MYVTKYQKSGKLFEFSFYSSPFWRRNDTKETREARKRLTDEAKKKINARNSKMSLARLIALNFDRSSCKVELTYNQDVGEKANAAILDKFHKLRRLRHKKRLYKYARTTECHRKTGEPCQLHNHLIITVPGGRRQLDQLRAEVREDWKRAAGELFGSVSVERLDDNIVDLAAYFCKEIKGYAKRRWTCSRNCKRPDKPVRRIVRDDAVFYGTPPGCTLIDQRLEGNEFGKFGWVCCWIHDSLRFGKWLRSREKKLTAR